jgi:chromosome segregation ATPase
MSTKDRYIVNRVDGFVCVCDTQDNEAPVDNGAVGLATLLNALSNANASLKDEVERLESDIKMEKENEDRLVREWQKANNEVYGQRSQIAALIDNQTRLNSLIANSEQENARLNTEVERLTKAGDLLAVHYTALSKCVTPNNAESSSINDWTSVIDWNAAKDLNK